MMPAIMGDSYVIECQGAGKVYRSLDRAQGFWGTAAAFFTRRMNEHVAFSDFDLQVRPGECVGLIGQNGAGKTSLVKCLTGITPVSHGSAHLLGRDAFSLTRAEKRRLALVMGQRSQLWTDIPAIDSFRLLKEIYLVDEQTFLRRVHERAERLSVAHRLRTQLRQLSLGERMKMEIIGAFLHDPEVAFLDEPTIGLDLISQESIRSFLRELNREQGVTIILTSHDMSDIEETCQRLVILDAGKKLFDGDLGDLKQRLVGMRAIELHLEPHSRAWSPALQTELTPFAAALVREAPLSLTFEVPSAQAQALIQHLFTLFEVRDLSIERQPLEHLIRDIFRTGVMEPRA